MKKAQKSAPHSVFWHLRLKKCEKVGFLTCTGKCAKIDFWQCCCTQPRVNFSKKIVSVPLGVFIDMINFEEQWKIRFWLIYLTLKISQKTPNFWAFWPKFDPDLASKSHFSRISETNANQKILSNISLFYPPPYLSIGAKISEKFTFGCAHCTSGTRSLDSANSQGRAI